MPENGGSSSRTDEAYVDELPSGTFARPRNLVAVDLDDPAIAASVQAKLAEAGRTVGGADTISDAAVVIADVTRDELRSRITELRSRMLPSAALLVVSTVLSAEAIEEAYRLGAAACMRPPIVPTEIIMFVDRLLSRREIEEKVARLHGELDLASHLASLGRVAGGIAHEIANPLTAVNADLVALEDRCRALTLESMALGGILAAKTPSALEEATERARRLVGLNEGEDVLGIVRDISTQCERMTDLVNAMRELSSKRPRSLEQVDLVEVARSTACLVPKDVLAGVQLDVVDDAPIVAVRANRLALEQILTNLVTNAAVFAKKLAAPRITIRAYVAGGEGILSVRDNGPGIPERLQPKVFEPFFTTRRGEGGTGLGLALCREYATQMGGRLSMWSVEGRGACFRVHLSRSEG